LGKVGAGIGCGVGRGDSDQRRRIRFSGMERPPAARPGVVPLLSLGPD
jgi:hypothetical protein